MNTVVLDSTQNQRRRINFSSCVWIGIIFFSQISSLSGLSDTFVIFNGMKYTFVISFFIYNLLSSRRGVRLGSKFFSLSMIFILCVSLSLITSQDIEGSILRLVLDIAMLLLISGWEGSSSSANKVAAMRAAIWTFSAIVTIGSIPILFRNNDLYYFQGNFKGYFYNANELGRILGTLCLPYMLYRALTRPRTKLIYLLIIIFFLLILLETRSRSGFLALLASLFYILIRLKRNIPLNRRRLSWLAIALFMGYGVFGSTYLTSKYENESTFSTRSYLWLAHIEAIGDRPVLGWGLGYNPISFKTDASGVRDTEKGNSYLAIIEEVGIPSSTVLFTSLLLFLLNIDKLATRGGLEEELLFLIPILFACLIHAFFESWLFYFGNSGCIFFWTSLAVLSSSQTSESERLS